jgi:hypothetical protein
VIRAPLGAPTPYNSGVEPKLEDALRVLREAAARAPDIRIELTPEYLRLIEAVEALPQNQSGADKSGRWRGSHAYWRFMREGRLVPPR